MAIQTRPGRMRMSIQQFRSLPEGPPFYDYVDGEAVEVNRPTMRHQHIMMRLANRLWEYTSEQGLGLAGCDVNVELPQGDIYGPDVVFLSEQHLDRYDEDKGYIRGAPDLIAEVLSPSTEAYDRTEKMGSYLVAEVPWVWLIEQDSLTVEEYRWTPDGYLRVGAVPAGQPFRPRLFPGLELDLKALVGAP